MLNLPPFGTRRKLTVPLRIRRKLTVLPALNLSIWTILSLFGRIEKYCSGWLLWEKNTVLAGREQWFRELAGSQPNTAITCCHQWTVGCCLVFWFPPLQIACQWKSQNHTRLPCNLFLNKIKKTEVVADWQPCSDQTNQQPTLASRAAAWAKREKILFICCPRVGSTGSSSHQVSNVIRWTPWSYHILYDITRARFTFKFQRSVSLSQTTRVYYYSHLKVTPGSSSSF